MAASQSRVSTTRLVEELPGGFRRSVLGNLPAAVHLDVFTAATRPAPETFELGAMIWNATTNIPNFSGETAPASGIAAWVDATGAVV